MLPKMRTLSYFVSYFNFAAKPQDAHSTIRTRTIETVFLKHKKICKDFGKTDIFIYPGFKFNVMDGLITNFHLPKSTLLMLVSAFAGKDLILNAYKEAVKKNYRFFSFGDAMFIF